MQVLAFWRLVTTVQRVYVILAFPIEKNCKENDHLKEYIKLRYSASVRCDEFISCKHVVSVYFLRLYTTTH